MAKLNIENLKRDVMGRVKREEPEEERREIESLEQEENKAVNDEIRVESLPLSLLADFPAHPFSRGSEEKMQELADSIGMIGVVEPLIVRRQKDAPGYELLSGHRRRDAAQMAGVDRIPAIVRELDDETATIVMAKANLDSRDDIPPTERGYAYKMMLDAIKRQGERSDLTSGHHGQKLDSRDKISEQTGESSRQVQRFIRLTELIAPLQEKVNRKRLGLVPGVAVSYLKPEEQEWVNGCMEEGMNISGEQAEKLKACSQADKWSDAAAQEILHGKAETQEKAPKAFRVSAKRFRELLPAELKLQTFTQEEAENVLEEAMELWRQNYERENGAMDEYEEMSV